MNQSQLVFASYVNFEKLWWLKLEVDQSRTSRKLRFDFLQFLSVQLKFSSDFGTELLNTTPIPSVPTPNLGSHNVTHMTGHPAGWVRQWVGRLVGWYWVELLALMAATKASTMNLDKLRLREVRRGSMDLQSACHAVVASLYCMVSDRLIKWENSEAMPFAAYFMWNSLHMTSKNP